MSCLVCNKKNRFLLCSKCRKNPFRVEDARHILASQSRLRELKNLYGKDYAEIKDLNTANFWNERIDDNVEHKPEDGMTKNRIKIACDFIPQEVKSVMDIGSGYGYIERLITKCRKDIKMFGNDISPNAIRHLNKRFIGSFKLESIHNMKYKPKSFDSVLMLEVLEHVPPAKTFRVIGDIKKMLTSKGYLIISVPSNEGLEKMKNNPNGHTRTYTPELIKAELKLAGFKIIDSKTLYAFPNLYNLKTFIAKFFPNRWKANNIVVLGKVNET